MPVIFSSSLLALPTALARYANAKPVEAVAAALNPSGPLYLPVRQLSSVQAKMHATSVTTACVAFHIILHAEVQFGLLELGGLCPFQPCVSMSLLSGAVVQTQFAKDFPTAASAAKVKFSH